MAPPPRKPAAPKPAELFIGNDSSTMMTEESFEEFEARMKTAQPAKEDDDDERTRSTAEAEPTSGDEG